MARIQILNLPGDGHPFALVIDQINWPDASASFTGTLNGVAEQVGARGILVFEDTVEIVGQGSAPPVPLAPADWYAKIGAIPAAAQGETDGSEQGDAKAILYGIQRVIDADDAEGLLMPEEIAAAEAAFLEATSIPKPFLWPLAVRIGGLLHLANGAE